MMGRISMVAHRGQPRTLPENSLQGFAYVLEAGVGYIETDIQITSDGIPVLSHDANLLELTGKQIIIADHEYARISEIPAGDPERFGDQFNDYRIASLQQLVDLLQQYPDVTGFIELKAATLDNFGFKAVDLVMQQLQPILSQVVLISFEYEALQYASQNYQIELGWVLPDWLDEYRQKALDLDPAFLFINRRYCPNEAAELWHGNWQWVAYTINDAAEIEHFAGLGIELIETDRYTEIIQESDIIEVSTDF
ncbi:MAG: glycerophosphodiester phosphodiesterase family protein [Gammaproteobacteria bacterium]|nr:glycerophosphodiester phosphodiesterase family protein [Gammaproteobacteria bacterium]